MRRRQNTAVALMTRAYVKLFALIYITTTVVVLSTVSYQLLESRTADAQRIVTSLRGADIDSRFDWANWRRNSTIDTRDTFVVIKSQQATYYSTGSEAFLKRIKGRHLWFGMIYKARERYFYYYQTGHIGNMTYQIYIGLAEVIGMVLTVSTALFVTLTVIFVLAIFIVRQLAQDLNAPLLTLTRAVKQLDQSGTKQLTLPDIDGAEEIVTLNQHLQDWLQQLQAQIEKERAFISNASHELKTPLAGFRGNIDLIKRRGATHPEIIPTAIAMLDKESRRMQNLVDTLLDMSRATDDHVNPPTVVQIAPVLQDIVTAFEIDTKRHVITTLTAFSVHLRVNEFAQLVRIILDNAAKYSAADSPIVVTSALNQVIIKDVGQGISAADKTRVFDRFYRGDDSRSETPGNGLGLALAQQLAARQNISIALSDNQPVGTIVTLTFLAPQTS